MFLEYYKLNDQPFGVSPDPGFLFLSPTHREALASLSYGVSAGRGFVALIAPPGMGKTTLLFKLLQKLDTSARTVFIFQTQCSPRDFLRNLLVDLGVDDSDGDLVRIQSELNKVLLRESHSGKRFVLVIDEAQNLDPSVLELVRMLSNFETPRQKLMNIVLAGQPQLAETLDSPDLVQLRQRVSIIAHLNAFTDEETRLYIDHRLRVAGYDCQHPLFTERALAMIASFSEGIPRNINNICFNALSLGCALKQRTIDGDVVREVLDDLDLGSLHRHAAIDSLSARSTSATPFQHSASTANTVRELVSANWARKVALAATLLLAVAWPVAAGQREAEVIAPQMPAVAKKISMAVTSLPAAAVSTGSAGSQVLGSTNAADVIPAATSETKLRTTEQWSRSAEQDTMNVLRTVRVVPNQTLYRISVENLGKYDDATLRKIRELNPWLNNPAYIKAGWEIRIPRLAEVPGNAFPTLEKATNSLALKAEQP
jgi:type II secretory pathway predicted ATPase ExeA